MKKITLNLTNESINFVEDLSDRLGLNKTTIVNKAIFLEKFIDDAIRDGGKIIVEKNGKQTEVVFR